MDREQAEQEAIMKAWNVDDFEANGSPTDPALWELPPTAATQQQSTTRNGSSPPLSWTAPPFQNNGSFTDSQNALRSPFAQPTTTNTNIGPGDVWVLDPMTRKLKVPRSSLIPTQATAHSGSVPSLCIGFLEGRCTSPWCRQAHVPLDVVTKLRHEAQCMPTCCSAHNSPFDTTFFTQRFKYIAIVLSGNVPSHRVYAADPVSTPDVVIVPAKHVALTVALQRHLAHCENSPNGNILEIPSRSVCRLHLSNRCRYIEDCNNFHLCREYDTVQEQLNANSRSQGGRNSNSSNNNNSAAATAQGGSIHPTPAPSASRRPAAGSIALPTPKGCQQQQNQQSPNLTHRQQNTSVTSPQPGPTSTSGALPVFHSSLGSTDNLNATTDSSPETEAWHVSSAEGSPTKDIREKVMSIVPHTPEVTVNGQGFLVNTLRVGQVTDEELKQIVDAQSTLVGRSRFAVVDLVGGESTIAAPAAQQTSSPAGPSNNTGNRHTPMASNTSMAGCLPTTVPRPSQRPSATIPLPKSSQQQQQQANPPIDLTSRRLFPRPGEKQ